jgi:hypothetical protein
MADKEKLGCGYLIVEPSAHFRGHSWRYTDGCYSAFVWSGFLIENGCESHLTEKEYSEFDVCRLRIVLVNPEVRSEIVYHRHGAWIEKSFHDLEHLAGVFVVASVDPYEIDHHQFCVRRGSWHKEMIDLITRHAMDMRLQFEELRAKIGSNQ